MTQEALLAYAHLLAILMRQPAPADDAEAA